MLKKRSKTIKRLFLIIFLVQILSMSSLLIMPVNCFAADDYKPAAFDANVPGLVDANATIGTYVQAIYKYAIGIVGILATVVMMWGGVIWITAAGNTERIANAKSWISASLTGLVLALASYTILYTVNPDLVKFKPLNVPELGKGKVCCHPDSGIAYPDMEEVNGVITPTCTSPTKEVLENQTCEKQTSGKFDVVPTGCCAYSNGCAILTQLQCSKLSKSTIITIGKNCKIYNDNLGNPNSISYTCD